MKPVIFLLLVYISSIISKTIHSKTLPLCIEPQRTTQHAERREVDWSDDQQDTQHPGYEAISTAQEPVEEITENEKDSQKTSLHNQFEDINDMTMNSNNTDINKQSNKNVINEEGTDIDINKESNVTDVNKESIESDMIKESNVTDINKQSNDTDINNDNNDSDINNESKVTDINNESNNNSTTQVDITVTGERIGPETEKSHIHDEINTNTFNINNASTEIVNNKGNITEKRTIITNKGLNDEVQDNTDITNIREVRAHLLDHLLEYFMNIIKHDKQYTQTRKKYNKDNMKLEDKLRNYYNPVHLDEYLYNNNSEDIDMQDYSNGRRDAKGIDDDKIVANDTDTVTTPNMNIESLKFINITTDEKPVSKIGVINGSLNQNNKTKMHDLHLQNENEQDNKTSNGELLLNIEENTNTLPKVVAIEDNIETCSTCTEKMEINDGITEKRWQNNENNMKPIKEIDERRKILISDENKSNDLKENSTQQKAINKNANNPSADHKPAKKSIIVKILDSLKSSLKIKTLKKFASKGKTENSINQNAALCPYNLVLQFNIHL